MNATLPTEGAADPYGLVGSTCADHRIEVLLDANGSGLVYRAAHVTTKTRVAVKVLRPGDDRAAVLARFADATASLATLGEGNHDIVAVKASGEVTSPRTGEALPFLVYEWVDGTLLSSYLAERRERKQAGRPLGDALDLLETAALALAHAHSVGIVHRDVRPSNLILARLMNGTHLKVLDFGVAQALGSVSADYAAPEQRDGGLVGPWTDIRALVLVLLEVMTGEHTAAVHAVVPTLDLPKGMPELLLRALADDAHERPAHLGVFWSSLRELSRSHVVNDAALAPTDANEKVSDRVQQMRAELGRQSTPSPFTGTMLMVGGSNNVPLRALEATDEGPGSTAPLAMPAVPPVSPHAMSIGLAQPIVLPKPPAVASSPLASSIGPQNQPAVTFAMPAQVTPPKKPTPQPFVPQAPPSQLPPSQLAARLPSVPPHHLAPPPAARSGLMSPRVFLLGLGVGVIVTFAILLAVWLVFLRP